MRSLRQWSGQRWALAAVPVLAAVGCAVALVAQSTDRTLGSAAAAVLVALAGYGVLRPDSRAGLALLVVALAAWAGAVPVPRGDLAWLVTLAAGWALLVTHSGLAALASWPEVAAVPRAVLMRWGRNLVLVAGAAVPVALAASLAQRGVVSNSQTVSAIGLALALAALSLLAWLLRARHTAPR